MTRPGCPVCGEDHAEVDCAVPICAACWRLSYGCECADPEPVSIADWIEAGREPARYRGDRDVDSEDDRRADAALERWKAERDERLIGGDRWW